MCSIDGRCIAAEVLENPLNHGRILDAGDHPELPAASSANLYVDGEHALEALRPGHRPLSVAGRWLAARPGLLGSSRPRPGHDPGPLLLAGYQPSASSAAAGAVKRSTVVKLPTALERDAEDARLLLQVIAYYRTRTSTRRRSSPRPRASAS